MFFALLLVFNLFSLVTSTKIATFSDSKCSQSVDNLTGPNGYPNGTCTPFGFSGNSSFQIVGLDPGCAVTIYGPDSNSSPCSSKQLAIARIAQCFNSSWVYYSIDGCDIPSDPPKSSATPSSSSSSSTSSSSSSSSSLSTATLFTSPAASSPTATSTPQSSNHTAVIVGGAVGGVAALALVAIAVLLFLRKRQSAKGEKLPPAYEMSNDRAIMEIPISPPTPRKPEVKVVRTEMYSHEAALEMGRNSIYVPPVELPDSSQRPEDKKLKHGFEFGISDKYGQ